MFFFFYINETKNEIHVIFIKTEKNSDLNLQILLFLIQFSVIKKKKKL